jgi:hypothetical protein
MFAIQRNDGKFFCNYNPGTGPGGFQRTDKCVNIWVHKYPLCVNLRRDKLRKIYLNCKIKTVKLTPSQLEHFTFVKLYGITK